MSTPVDRQLWQCPKCEREILIPIEYEPPRLCRVCELAESATVSVANRLSRRTPPENSATPAKRRLWECPACAQKYRIPADAAEPKLCPRCAKAADAIPERPVNEPRWRQVARFCSTHAWATGGAVGVMLGLLVFVIVVASSKRRLDPAGDNESRLAVATEKEAKSAPDGLPKVLDRLPQPPAQPRPQPVKLEPKDIYATAVKSVVVIRSVRSKDGSLDGLGSGFVLAPDNVIVTNEHVIRGASSLKVKTRDGTEADVTRVHAVDKERDIAVLPLPAKLWRMPGLKAAKALPSVGDTVYAIGAPKGLTFSLSKGIVSQIRRNPVGKGNLIQTDASISPGSSGGPLLNERGELVGINRLSWRGGQNLNFAVAAVEINSLHPFSKLQRLTQLDGYKEFQKMHAVIEITKDNVETLVGRQAKNIRVAGIRLGMSRVEAERLLRQSDSLVGIQDQFNRHRIIVYKSTAVGKKGGDLFQLIWDSPSEDNLKMIVVWERFKSYLAPKFRRLFSREILDESSEFRKSFLGGPTRTEDGKKGYGILKNSMYHFDAIGLTIVDFWFRGDKPEIVINFRQ